MRPASSPRRTSSWARPVVAAGAIALLLAACGGGDAGGGTAAGGDGSASTLPTTTSDLGTDNEGEGTATDSTAAGDAAAAGDVDLDRRGSLSLTVPGVSSRTEGDCFFDGDTRAVFAGDDGRTQLDLQQGAGDTNTASGQITFDVEGEAKTWVVSATSSHAAMELATGIIYYEGDFVIGDETVFGIVQMTCE